ncbi:uncharacterized protein KIAA1614 homolog [Narcine bancroftii]|uniref:uncharacterized protein KIAA1614 homolog n=1 Tax=Narcine bancroftii TaxID=1343680 RepID=UPI0038318764
MDRNELSKKYPRICHGIQNLNALTLQNKMQVLKGNWSQDSQLSMNRAGTEQNKSRDWIPLEGSFEDKPHEEKVSTGSCRYTYLTDNILDHEEGQFNVGKKPLGKCINQDLSRRMMDTINLKTSPSLKGENPDKCNTKDWRSPKEFWKVFGMENVGVISSAEKCDDMILPNEVWNINESEISSSCLKSLSEGLPKAHVLDNSATKSGAWSVENAHKLGHFGGFWRTDSWESVSNARLFSLTENVELNRTKLKRMLTSSPPQQGPGIGFKSLPQQSLAPASCQFQSNPVNDSFPRNKYNKQGCRIHQDDSDWNSGISLQGSGHRMRAFVSSSQLPLSPRHELAKLLLERARMKARASPLKADHSILPMVKSSADISTNVISSPNKGPFSMEECLLSAQNSYNLSDSPNGESHGGPHKKRTQFPSHVRFEDESTLEAAVRYQLRRKGGLESSIRSIPGSLQHKPGLPSDRILEKEYMLGSESRNLSKPFHRDTEVIRNWNWKSGVNPLATGKAGESTFGKAKGTHFNAALCIDGKCSCCGSYIISAAKAICIDPPSYEFPDASTLHQGREPQRPSHHKFPASNAVEVGTNLGVEAPDVGAFAPRIIPFWVLPSQHRIKIEPIKETYIGEITSIDDVSVTEGNAANTVLQEMKDCRESKISTCCSAIMPKTKDSSASSIELNAIGIGNQEA